MSIRTELLGRGKPPGLPMHTVCYTPERLVAARERERERIDHACLYHRAIDQSSKTSLAPPALSFSVFPLLPISILALPARKGTPRARQLPAALLPLPHYHHHHQRATSPGRRIAWQRGTRKNASSERRQAPPPLGLNECCGNAIGRGVWASSFSSPPPSPPPTFLPFRHVSYFVCPRSNFVISAPGLPDWLLEDCVGSRQRHDCHFPLRCLFPLCYYSGLTRNTLPSLEA